MSTHAAMPIAHRLGGSAYRIYFSTRDGGGHSHVGLLEVDIARPDVVERLGNDPALAPGPRGFFDDSGVFPGPVIEIDGVLRMYYAGRNNGHPPLFYMAIGVAESRDGGMTFERMVRAPVMARSEHDPWMVSTPFVLRERALWRMWYLSGTGWDAEDEERSYYDVKYASSEDGLSWSRDGTTCIPLGPGESNIGNPCVLVSDGSYRMWFSYVRKGGGYRIGYAESEDGIEWSRSAEADFEPSGEGWDGDAVSYPFVFEHDGRLYMLYSGNGYGRDGFGLAVRARLLPRFTE